MYLTPRNSTDPVYVKTGYTSQLGAVIENHMTICNYSLSMGYNWTLPSTATSAHAIDIKNKLRESVIGLSKEETYAVIGQYRDLYSMADHEKIFAVLDETIKNYKFETPTKTVLPERTKPKTTKQIVEVSKEEQLKLIVSNWIKHKTVDKLQQLLPAFKTNNKQYTSDEIDAVLIKLILGTKCNNN